ncbi:MAG: ATP synthase F1 subunit gamma [Acidobacteria bacterium]|nr:MAG: ATP synthase F1 subunit gamma [Acidobacteriota bacterium]REK03695.1 MAG: ATP synthase F1 subunit gamma [Acidobacteriota bacterium]
MPNLIDLRRRVRSVKNMQQIFRAMKMISASRLRRSQEHILATRPYALQLRKVTQNLSAQAGEAEHPLLQVRPEEKVLLAVVSGDKGLCGSFNANLLRQADLEIKRQSDKQKLELLCLGKRASDYYGRRTHTIRAAYKSLFRNVTYEQAQEIADDVQAAFIAGEYDAVYLIYNQFVSVMTQTVTVERLLPLEPPSDEEADGGQSADYIYEPSASELLDVLLPRFVTFQVYRVLLESQAAEHAARMTAMDAATKNAGELMDKLTLIMNRTRQAAITTELIEVVSGASAMEG